MQIQAFMMENTALYYIYGFALIYFIIVLFLHHRLRKDHPELANKIPWKDFNHLLLYNRLKIKNHRVLEARINNIRRLMLFLYVILAYIVFSLLWSLFSFYAGSGSIGFGHYVIAAVVLFYIFAFVYRYKKTEEVTHVHGG